MNYIKENISTILIGILTGIFWVVGFGKIYQLLYGLLGSPEQMTSLLIMVILVQSFVMGAIPGIIVVFLTDRTAREIVGIFVAVVAIFLIISTALAGGTAAIAGLVTSFTTWLFFLGIVVGCFSMQRAKNT